MKKLYERSELAFSIVWIVAYCILLSLGDNISESIGITKSVTLPIAAVLSFILFIYIKHNKLMKKYGFCKPSVPGRKMLFYIPLILLLTVNLWFGVRVIMTPAETVLYILTMLLVGFLEETIFRGLLFGAMAEDGVKSAIIVSSITFGIGHIINLFNGSGADLLPNLLQVGYAITTGFMLVMIFLKSKSLIICIAFHGIFNLLSVFSDEAVLSIGQRLGSSIFIMFISMAYGVYLICMKETDSTETDK